jgi:predicted permease
MLLARAAGRRREMATRLAVGATRGRVVRQLVVESVMLGVLGGMAGVLIAAVIARGLDAWQPPFPIPVAIDFSIDGEVLALALVTVLGTGLLTGLVPAIQGSGVDLATAMKEGGLQGGPGRARLRSALVVAQVAVSVVLLAVAGLFVRSLDRALHVDPGFDPTHVVHAAIDLAPNGYDDARARSFDAQLLARLRVRPEIAAASIGNNAPLGSSSSTSGVTAADRPDAEHVEVQWSDGDVGIVELLRTPLLAGRTFTARDTKDATPVTVINETLAHRLWPRTPLERVVGRRLQGRGRELTVVGVIGNGKYLLLQEDPRAFGWTPFAQSFSRTAMIFVRAGGSVDDAIRALREEVASIDPNIALHGVALMEGDVSRLVIPQRIAATLVGIFGAAGLLLSMAGLYGVLAYAVTQRLREFGVRMALGARGTDLVRLMIRHGVGLVVAGITIGLVGAAVAGRLVARFLYGVGGGDLVTLSLVPVTLLTVSLVACIIPARRAASADPMTSLRAE